MQRKVYGRQVGRSLSRVVLPFRQRVGDLPDDLAILFDLLHGKVGAVDLCMTLIYGQMNVNIGLVPIVDDLLHMVLGNNIDGQSSNDRDTRTGDERDDVRVDCSKNLVHR